jgi:hypothetical protein
MGSLLSHIAGGATMKQASIWKSVTVSLLLVACGRADYEDENPIEEEIEQPSEATALIRVAHGSADAPAVDVYARGIDTPLFAALSYGMVSDYVGVPHGSYTVDVRAAGAEATSAPVFSAAVIIEEGQQLSIVAAGLLGGQGGGEFRLMALDDDVPKPGFGHSRLRLLHAGADAPAVDIDLGSDGELEIVGLDRWSTSDALDVPSGRELTLGVLAGGTPVTSFTTPRFPDKGAVTLVAIGLLSERPAASTGFSLLAFSDEGIVEVLRQDPVIYALHASPDAPAVDIYAGESRLVEGLSFGTISGATQVPAGTYELDFTAAGSAVVAASSDAINIEAGGRYLVTATGFLSRSGDEAFRVIAVDDEFPIAGTDALVRVIHAAADAPAVDLGPLYGPVVHPILFAELNYGDSTVATGSALDAGTLELGLAASGQPEALLDFTLAPSFGQRLFVVAAGALVPGHLDQAFRLIVVDASSATWTASSIFRN